MNPGNIISDELKKLAPVLVPALGIQVYEVPEHYFEEFALSFYPNKILNLNPAMEVPEGYFEGFAASVIDKIKAAKQVDAVPEEIEQHSPLMYTAGKKMPYSVPEGYFDSFSKKIEERLQPAKVIRMAPGRKSVLRYAVAAVVTGLLGLGIFNGLNNKEDMSGKSDRNLILAEARNILSTNSFEQTLESIPAEDIVNYLENNGQDVNAAIVAVAASQENLPEPEEYLFDEQALEKFLNGVTPETLN